MVTLEIIFLVLAILLCLSTGLVISIFQKLPARDINSDPSFYFTKGLAALILLVGIFYQLRMPINFIYVLTIFTLAVFVVSLKEKFLLFIKSCDKLYIIGVLLLIVYSVIGSENYKAFQGYIYDRFSYLSSALIYRNLDYGLLNDQIKNIFSTGNTSHLYIEPLMNRVPGSLGTRPIIEYFFAFLTQPFGSSSYLLANAFENLARILFFSICYSTFNLISKNKKLILLSSLAIAIGFTGQFLKDYNAWSMQFALPLSMTIFYFLLREEKSLKNKILEASLIYGVAFAIYPEGILFVSGIYAISLLIIFHKEIQRLIDYIKILSISSIIYFVLNYSRLDFLTRQFEMSSGFSPVVSVKNLYAFLPFYNYTLEEKASLFEKFLNNPHEFKLLVIYFINFIPAFFGCYLVNKFGILIEIFFCILIIYLTIEKLSKNKINESVKIFMLISLLLPFILLINGKVYGFSRAVCYTSSIATFCLIIYCLKNYKYSLISKLTLFTFLSCSAIFSACTIKSILENNKPYLQYTFSFDRLINDDHFTDYKIKNNINTSQIIPYLKSCKSINIDVDDKWLASYALIMSQNSMAQVNPTKRLTGIWDGDKMEINNLVISYDCTITTFEASTAIEVYKLWPFERVLFRRVIPAKTEIDLIFNNYDKKLSVKRGPIGE